MTARNNLDIYVKIKYVEYLCESVKVMRYEINVTLNALFMVLWLFFICLYCYKLNPGFISIYINKVWKSISDNMNILYLYIAQS